jgi:hypothetical protein
MLEWLTFLQGWLAGYGAADGDRNATDLVQQAYTAYREFIAETHNPEIGHTTTTEDQW